MGNQWEPYNQDYIGGPMRPVIAGYERLQGGGGGGGGNEMGDQWELYNQGYIGGAIRWGTNESRVGKGNEMGDQ